MASVGVGATAAEPPRVWLEATCGTGIGTAPASRGRGSLCPGGQTPSAWISLVSNPKGGDEPQKNRKQQETYPPDRPLGPGHVHRVQILFEVPVRFQPCLHISSPRHGRDPVALISGSPRPVAGAVGRGVGAKRTRRGGGPLRPPAPGVVGNKARRPALPARAGTPRVGDNKTGGDRDSVHPGSSCGTRSRRANGAKRRASREALCVSLGFGGPGVRR